MLYKRALKILRVVMTRGIELNGLENKIFSRIQSDLHNPDRIWMELETSGN